MGADATTPTSVDITPIIAPAMFREALAAQGITTVGIDDEGRAVVTDADAAIGELVSAMLTTHFHRTMVLESNVGALRGRIVSQVGRLAVEDNASDRREMGSDLVEDICGIANNLDPKDE